MTLTETVETLIREIEQLEERKAKGIFSCEDSRLNFLNRLDIAQATAKGLLLGLDEIENLIKTKDKVLDYEDIRHIEFVDILKEITLAQKKLREVVGK